MKLLHFGDIHVWDRTPYPIEWYYPKRWLGPINLLIRRAKRFPPALRQQAVDAVLQQDADVVLFSGDFTNFSLESEFREAARLFAPLREKWGDRLIAIPGNHDVYTGRSVRRQLLEKHLPWVRTERAWTVELVPGRDLIGVHHAVPLWVRSNGVVTEETQAAVSQELSASRDRGNRAIVMGHFAYATPPEHPETAEHRLIGEEAFAKVISEASPDAYLHGHKHVRWALRSPLSPTTVCLNCGSVSMTHSDPDKHAGFLTFTWGNDDEISHLTRIDHRVESGDWVPSPLPVSDVAL